MHEVTHQLSFNCGLLNRNGDVPAWLAEGLACYCESTDKGAWQGIGEPNANRAATLVKALRGTAPLPPVRRLIEDDEWLRSARTTDQILVGYAQSWALFTMLMEQQPRSLRKYLALIESRRTADHRLADFTEVFDTNLDKLDANYHTYIRNVVQQQVRK